MATQKAWLEGGTHYKSLFGGRIDRQFSKKVCVLCGQFRARQSEGRCGDDALMKS
jgi:hypothetical protein